MAIDQKTPFGKINISTELVADVAGEAATTCYGVVGLADRSAIWENIAELLQRSDYDKGVYCRKKKDGYSVDVYIVVAYGVKITEVLREVQKKVAYDLNKSFGKCFHISYGLPIWSTKVCHIFSAGVLRYCSVVMSLMSHVLRTSSLTNCPASQPE